MKVLGIDPGLKGALATWDGRRLHVADVPIVKARGRGNEINLPALADIVRNLTIQHSEIGRLAKPYDEPFEIAYVERNSVRPKEGISSAQKNGLVAGILLGCIAMCCRQIYRPTPQQWKKVMRLTKDKNYSITKAIEAFPDYYDLFTRKKDHGRAEAALLAFYGYTASQTILFDGRTRKHL